MKQCLIDSIVSDLRIIILFAGLITGFVINYLWFVQRDQMSKKIEMDILFVKGNFNPIRRSRKGLKLHSKSMMIAFKGSLKDIKDSVSPKTKDGTRPLITDSLKNIVLITCIRLPFVKLYRNAYSIQQCAFEVKWSEKFVWAASSIHRQFESYDWRHFCESYCSEASVS